MLAESVARIHRRNSIALGLPAFTVPGITTLVSDGEEIEIGYADRQVLAGDGTLLAPLADFPASAERVYEAGVPSAVLRERLAEVGFPAPVPA